MSYQIAFKGKLEPLTVSNERGKYLMEAVSAGNKGMVEIDGAMFDIGSIKAIMPDGSDFKQSKATREEMDDLEKKLLKFPQKEVNGKLLSPFDQYLISIDVRGQYDNGILFCVDPKEDTRLGKINSEMETREYYKWKNKIDTVPGALDEHWKGVRERFPIRPSSKIHSEKLQSIGNAIKNRFS